jgi:catechol 2,3-dioxygenase-like lactoylglutathione lyase family enzyme
LIPVETGGDTIGGTIIMKIRLAHRIAINTHDHLHARVTQFYRALGLETQELAPGLVSLAPAPYSLFVVAWEPTPPADGELCLQAETDDLDDLKARVEAGDGEIVYFGDDPNSPGRRHLWFRDPAGTLMNVIELDEEAK